VFALFVPCLAARHLKNFRSFCFLLFTSCAFENSSCVTVCICVTVCMCVSECVCGWSVGCEFLFSYNRFSCALCAFSFASLRFHFSCCHCHCCFVISRRQAPKTHTVAHKYKHTLPLTQARGTNSATDTCAFLLTFTQLAAAVFLFLSHTLSFSLSFSLAVILSLPLLSALPLYLSSVVLFLSLLQITASGTAAAASSTLSQGVRAHKATTTMAKGPLITVSEYDYTLLVICMYITYIGIQMILNCK